MQTTDFQTSRTHIVRAVSGAMILLLAIIGLGFVNHINAGNLRQRAGASLDMERNIEEVISAVKDAETGQRGYLLTGKMDYLEPYEDARERATREFNAYKNRAKSALPNSKNVVSLDSLLVIKFYELDKTINLRKSGQSEAAYAIMGNDSGRLMMNHIRTITKEMKLARRNEVEALRTKTDTLYWINIILNGVGLAVLLGIIVYLYRSLSPLLTHLSVTIEARDNEIIHRMSTEADLERMITRLKVKNEELDNFAYLASHDLQEPLRTVSNFVGIIDEEFGGKLGQDGAIYMGFINKATERMRDLIQYLLTYSQLGRTGQSEAVSLEKSLHAALENLKGTISERRAIINSEPLPTVTGHPIELVSLFQNLLSNAIKFTPPEKQPVVEISCEESPQRVTVNIKDQGIGINEVTGRKIFKMFSRVHPTGIYEGSGIGLTFCRRIVELHGGNLTMESIPGRGSTFSFTIDKNTV